jgi:phosphopantetheine--protein transferase-like protein
MLSAEFRKIVANILHRPASDVGTATSLALSSFDRAKLAAAVLRYFGRKPSEIVHARTIGELEAILFTGQEDQRASPPPIRVNGREPESNAQPSQPLPPSFGAAMSPALPNMLCGIDLEPVASLPEALDYWEDDFYKTVFTPVEIAYCVAQEEPAMHFAARWCAKEALRKCDPRFATVDYTELELARTETGGLRLRHLGNGTATVLPHAVSVTHTPQMAASVVVLGVSPDSAAGATPPPPDPACAECAKSPSELRQSQARLLKTIDEAGHEIWLCTACFSVGGQPAVMGFE